MIDYKKSGVDIQAGDDLVSWLQTPQDSTSQPINPIFLNSDVPDYQKRVVSGIGGFASLFDGRFHNLKHPVLVSCTDGVGTKVKLAAYFNDFSGVGQDLVAMCANDLICTGGTPLFFLDYYAVGKLELDKAQQFLTSVKNACQKAHLVLIGGETAEMPGVYHSGDFDCAGFSVGVVDKEKIWGAHLVNEGDVVIGLESSGYHSNGYSLIRKVFENEFDQYRHWLLEPTKLYVEAGIMLKNEFEIHAMSHITGGGIENLPRVMPTHLKAVLNRWEFPECYKEIQKRSKLTDKKMLETFNCGIGLMVIIKSSDARVAQERLNEIGYKAQVLGKIHKKLKDESDVEWI